LVNLKDWITVNFKWWVRRTLKLRGDLETRIDSIIKQINEICNEVCHTVKEKLAKEDINCSNLNTLFENQAFPKNEFLFELRKKRVDMENDIYHDYHQFCNVPTIRGFSGLLGFILSVIGFLVSSISLLIYYKTNEFNLKSLMNDETGIFLTTSTVIFLFLSVYLLFREHKKIDVKNKEYWSFWLKETGDEYRKTIPLIHRVLLFIALLMEGYIIALTIVSFISSEINLRTATYISIIAGLTVAFFLEQLGIDAGKSLYRLDVARNLNRRFEDQVEFLGEKTELKEILMKINPNETATFEYLPKANFIRKYSKLILSLFLFLSIGIILFIQRTNIKFNIFSEESNPEITYSAALLLLIMFLAMYIYTVWVGHKYSYASEYSEIARYGLKNYNKVQSHNRKLSEVAQKNFHSFFISLTELLEESSSRKSADETKKKAYKCMNARGEYEFKCSDS